MLIEKVKKNILLSGKKLKTATVIMFNSILHFHEQQLSVVSGT